MRCQIVRYGFDGRGRLCGRLGRRFRGRLCRRFCRRLRRRLCGWLRRRFCRRLRGRLCGWFRRRLCGWLRRRLRRRLCRRLSGCLGRRFGGRFGCRFGRFFGWRFGQSLRRLFRRRFLPRFTCFHGPELKRSGRKRQRSFLPLVPCLPLEQSEGVKAPSAGGRGDSKHKEKDEKSASRIKQDGPARFSFLLSAVF